MNDALVGKVIESKWFTKLGTMQDNVVQFSQMINYTFSAFFHLRSGTQEVDSVRLGGNAMWLHNDNTIEQAGAELGQAQLKVGFDFILIFCRSGFSRFGLVVYLV